jgi:hypothetical protein
MSGGPSIPKDFDRVAFLVDYVPRQDLVRLKAAAQTMLQRYLDLANSGDAGFWDPEKELEVIALRDALNDGSKEGS